MSSDRLRWPDGSSVTVGQPVRIVVAQPRYAGKVGNVASLRLCHPQKDNAATPECTKPELHDEIGVDGLAADLAWFRVSELQRTEARSDGHSSPESPATRSHGPEDRVTRA